MTSTTIGLDSAHDFGSHETPARCCTLRNLAATIFDTSAALECRYLESESLSTCDLWSLHARAFRCLGRRGSAVRICPPRPTEISTSVTRNAFSNYFQALRAPLVV